MRARRSVIHRVGGGNGGFELEWLVLKLWRAVETERARCEMETGVNAREVAAMLRTRPANRKGAGAEGRRVDICWWRFESGGPIGLRFLYGGSGRTPISTNRFDESGKLRLLFSNLPAPGVQVVAIIGSGSRQGWRRGATIGGGSLVRPMPTGSRQPAQHICDKDGMAVREMELNGSYFVLVNG